MNDDDFIERDVLDYNIIALPFDSYHNNTCLPDPSMVRLCFPNRKSPLDVGCLVYGKRKPHHSNKACGKGVILVRLSSFIQSRQQQIVQFLDAIFTLHKIGELRAVSLVKFINQFKLFIDWADGNDHDDVLSNFKSAKRALRVYMQFLEHSVRVGNYRQSAAYVLATATTRAISLIYNVELNKITYDMRIIPKAGHRISTTIIPLEQNVSDVLRLCEIVFAEMSDFILNNKKYPYRLALPEEKVWILPINKWMATRVDLANRENWPVGYWAWDYTSATINFADTIYCQYSHPETARNVIISAKTVLLSANKDERHHARMNLAMFAHDAFLVQFFANTGMNLAQVRDLQWDDNFSITTECQGFKAIKYRAQGKKVEFYISTPFLSKFKQYLKLRRYLLNGQSYPLLFMSLGLHADSPPKKISLHPLDNFMVKARRNIAPNLPSISARQWRSYKANFLLKHTDPEQTAMILQNSISTTLQSYANGTEKESEEELTLFFDRVNESLSADSISSPVGCCVNMGHPLPLMVAKTQISPDCKQPEGCLFCQHYALHADEHDIRKLCSLAFVITQTAALAASEQHHNTIFYEVTQRIEKILAILGKKSEQIALLVTKIREDVEQNENLDTYWEAKLNMLDEIGAI